MLCKHCNMEHKITCGCGHDHNNHIFGGGCGIRIDGRLCNCDRYAPLPKEVREIVNETPTEFATSIIDLGKLTEQTQKPHELAEVQKRIGVLKERANKKATITGAIYGPG